VKAELACVHLSKTKQHPPRIGGFFVVKSAGSATEFKTGKEHDGKK